MTRLDYIWIAALTVAMELVTCFFRFGMKLRSTHDTAWLARFTLGIRIHHGYIGVLMVVVALMLAHGVFRTWLVHGGAKPPGAGSLFRLWKRPRSSSGLGDYNTVIGLYKPLL